MSEKTDVTFDSITHKQINIIYYEIINNNWFKIIFGKYKITYSMEIKLSLYYYDAAASFFIRYFHANIVHIKKLFVFVV